MLVASAITVACGGNNPADRGGAATPSPKGEPPAPSLQMGGAKSVTRFFIISTGMGNGGDLGGLAGADAHCEALAKAEGSGDHTWRAYLSTAATATQPAINARDRIGSGPWYNALGELVAMNLEQLHGSAAAINKETALTERGDPVNGVGDKPNRHDILTGSRQDGTAFAGTDDLTCGNWTSSRSGRARVGHHDRMGEEKDAQSWNSAHASRGCSQDDLERTGGDGLFYCFAVN